MSLCSPAAMLYLSVRNGIRMRMRHHTSNTANSLQDMRIIDVLECRIIVPNNFTFSWVWWTSRLEWLTCLPLMFRFCGSRGQSVVESLNEKVNNNQGCAPMPFRPQYALYLKGYVSYTSCNREGHPIPYIPPYSIRQFVAEGFIKLKQRHFSTFKLLPRSLRSTLNTAEITQMYTWNESVTYMEQFR